VLAAQSPVFARLFKPRSKRSQDFIIPIRTPTEQELAATDGSEPAGKASDTSSRAETPPAADGGLAGFMALLQHYYSDMVAVSREQQAAVRAFAHRAGASHLVASLAAELAMMGYKPMLAEAEEQRAEEEGADDDVAGSADESDGEAEGEHGAAARAEQDEQDETIELSATGGLGSGERSSTSSYGADREGIDRSGTTGASVPDERAQAEASTSLG